MKIRYKKKRLNSNLFIGIAWSIFALLALSYIGDIRWIDFGYLAIAVLYIGQFIYEYRNQYLTIKNGTIWKNGIFRKKIELEKIIWIKKFAGDYILKTDTRELTINTDWIDEKSILELNSVLEKLDLPPEKTPFANTVYN